MVEVVHRGVPKIVGAARETLTSLQYLRALAALLVVFHHSQEQLRGIRALVGSTFGVGGVDIFFIISGFVMFYTTSRSSVTAGQFFSRRLIRIVPLYWVMTIVTAVLLLLLPSAVKNSQFSLVSLINSLLFIPHENPGKIDSLHPMLKLGWTLNFEMFFYVIFAAFLWASAGKRVLLLAGVFLLVIILAMLWPDAPAPIRFWGDPILFEFLLGGMFALNWKRPWVRTMPSWALVATFVAACVLLITFSELECHRFFKRGLPALLIVASALLLEQRASRPIAFRIPLLLGDASYSIYLVHLYAMIFFRIVWQQLQFPQDDLASGLIYVSLCVCTGTLAGVLVYKFIERPLTNFARDQFRRLTWS